jgi:hypothetical protein
MSQHNTAKNGCEVDFGFNETEIDFTFISHYYSPLLFLRILLRNIA